MTISVIGTGHIGTIVASQLAHAGVKVLVSSSSLEVAKKSAEEIGHGVLGVENKEAVERSDVVIFATWFNVTEVLLKEFKSELIGKVVVDTSNPLGPDGQGGFKKVIPENESSGENLGSLVDTKTDFVKALGTLGAASLEAKSNSTPLTALLYATNSERGGREVSNVIKKMGFVPVNAGMLNQSIRIEVGGDLHEMGGLGTAPTYEQARAALGLR